MSFLYYKLGWPNCQTTSDLHISNSFEKLRSFYTQLILIVFFYSGFKGSRKSSKLLQYPKREQQVIKALLFSDKGLALTVKQKYYQKYLFLFQGNAKKCTCLDHFRDPLNMVQKQFFWLIGLGIISAFQNCSKFEDRTYFGKLHYPKENISYSVSDKVLENQNWATLLFTKPKFGCTIFPCTFSDQRTLLLHLVFNS